MSDATCAICNTPKMQHLDFTRGTSERKCPRGCDDRRELHELQERINKALTLAHVIASPNRASYVQRGDDARLASELVAILQGQGDEREDKTA